MSSATDPIVRRAYLSVVANVDGTTIQQVMRDYNCTEHEAKEARRHARLHGAGACVKKVKFSRQRMSVSQCKFLTSMSVNRGFVYRPASTATHTVQFKREYSLREGYKVFLERLEQHYSQLPRGPDSEDWLRVVRRDYDRQGLLAAEAVPDWIVRDVPRLRA